MSFIASPAPTAAPPAAPGDEVANDGWFPAVKLSETRAILCLTTAVTDARLADAIRGAIMSANRQLADWTIAREAAGFANLAAVPSPGRGKAKPIDGYARAVRAYVAAELADLEGEISATDAGRERIETRHTTATEHRRIAIHAIRDILDVRRTKVRLV
jgi:hypothetical protein